MGNIQYRVIFEILMEDRPIYSHVYIRPVHHQILLVSVNSSYDCTAKRLFKPTHECDDVIYSFWILNAARQSPLVI